MLCTYCKLNQMTVSDRAKVLVIIKNNSKVDWIDAPIALMQQGSDDKKMNKQKVVTEANVQSCTQVQAHTYPQRAKHSNTHIPAESVINRSTSLLSCSFYRSCLVKRPKIRSCIFSWLKPSIFRESICGNVSPQLPLPCPEEREREK